MLSPDDESVLSAYIDGELDPLETRRVGDALASDILLAEKVQALRKVKGLVSGLSRPRAPALSDRVQDRIQLKQRQLRTWQRVKALAPWAVGLAAAAAIGLFFSLATLQRWVAPVPPLRVPENRVQPALGELEETGRARVASDRLASDPDRLSTSSELGRVPRVLEASSGFPGAVVNRDPAIDRDRIRSLVDDARLRRIFLITDRLGGPAEERVTSVVERITHRDYFKITISQGIVIDPLRPGEATVFAVVLDETEMSPFRNRLENVFGDRLKDYPVDPSITMQLADVGQVVSCPARPAADVTIPIADLALRASTVGEPTPEQERSSPAAELQKSAQKATGGAIDLPRHGATHESPEVTATRHDGAPFSGPTMKTSPPASRGAASDGYHVVLIWITRVASG